MRTPRPTGCKLINQSDILQVRRKGFPLPIRKLLNQGRCVLTNKLIPVSSSGFDCESVEANRL